MMKILKGILRGVSVGLEEISGEIIFSNTRKYFRINSKFGKVLKGIHGGISNGILVRDFDKVFEIDFRMNS